jgi:KipI family sensor histidine kinase inhibitor
VAPRNGSQTGSEKGSEEGSEERFERWRWVGDRALLRRTPASDLAAANRAARALAVRIGGLGAPEVVEVVPGAATVLVLLADGAEPGAALREVLDAPADPSPGAAGRLHEIPVRYGGGDGPDLEEVAHLHGLTAGEVVRLHAGAEYVVGFIGFSPGFPYLLGLPGSLVTPRLASPRTKVPAGSVAIGGEFTGIYPSVTPGGWRILGRTDVTLFDARRDPPALLAAGDRVRFVPR